MPNTDSKPIGLAVVGYGYWSPKLIRNILASKNFRLVAICEKNEARQADIAAAHPGVKIYTHYRDTFGDEEVDAVIVGTVISSHHRIAKMALEHGKHVLVEKPLATNVRDAKELQQLAARAGLVLMVDHTYLYNPAIERLREIVQSGELGEIVGVHSSRLNLGLVQHDANVLFDLAPHDFSVIQFLFSGQPTHVSAIGSASIVHPRTNKAVESAVHATVFYPDFQASVDVSWLSPVKVRQLVVIGNKKSVVYDQLAADGQLKLYDKGVDVSDSVLSYRDNGYKAIEFPDGGEDLARVIDDFARAIRTHEAPRSHAGLGVEVTRILAAAQRSIKRGGKKLALNAGLLDFWGRF